MMLLKSLCAYDTGTHVPEWSKLYKTPKYSNLLVFIFLKSVIKTSKICKYKKLNQNKYILFIYTYMPMR